MDRDDALRWTTSKIPSQHRLVSCRVTASITSRPETEQGRLGGVSKWTLSSTSRIAVLVQSQTFTFRRRSATLWSRDNVRNGEHDCETFCDHEKECDGAGETFEKRRRERVNSFVYPMPPSPTFVVACRQLLLPVSNVPPGFRPAEFSHHDTTRHDTPRHAGSRPVFTA